MKRLSRLRLRLFPVTIFVAALMLTVKVGDVWRGLSGTSDPVSVAALQAQQADAPETAAEQEAAGGDAETAATEQGDGEATSATELLEELEGEGESLGTAFTPAEIEVLQNLQARREALDARAGELDLRAQMLRAAEHTLAAKIDEWKLLKNEVEELVRAYDEQQLADLQRLATYYEKMKPKDAARIFNELPMEELLSIVERMNDTKTAAVIAEMDTAKAMELTSELAARSPIALPEAATAANN